MSGRINPELIRHIAELSRIELDEERIEHFTEQLSSIIGYFDKLNELDTENVEPLTHPIELSNALRPDEPAASLSAEQALAGAPDEDGSFFKVPKVLEDS
jgi:aspartyl-tRNA(Asn)/glutamyl-tRNA(Gln) amidotransferase subunit C